MSLRLCDGVQNDRLVVGPGWIVERHVYGVVDDRVAACCRGLARQDDCIDIGKGGRACACVPRGSGDRDLFARVVREERIVAGVIDAITAD